MKQGGHQLKTKGNVYKFLCFVLFITNNNHIIFAFGYSKIFVFC